MSSQFAARTRHRVAMLMVTAAALTIPNALRAQAPDSALVAPDSTSMVVSQQGTPQGTAAQPATVRLPQPLFRKRDAVIAGVFALGAGAMMPLDLHLAEEIRSPGAQTNAFFGRLADRMEGIATPGAYYFGGSLYLVGRVGAALSDAEGYDRAADLGWHGLKAVMLSEGMGYMLKGAIGRARPYVSDATRPQDWRFGSGFSTTARRSFPSGHTYTAFSMATVVTSELHRWWPRATWAVAPVMYSGATLVGLSRMYHNKHWASDIVAGAAIGTLIGLKVVQHGHDNPRNLIDRVMLGASVLPDGRGGMGLGWKAHTPF